MEIILSEEAMKHLQSLTLENKSIRLRAIDTNSCNATIEYDLMIDERSEKDKIVQVDSFTFLYDDRAYEDIGPYVKIDFIPSQGLKMINKNQILAYGLRLNV